MAIDPRLFLGIGGPMPPQAMLQPGFRPPGPGPGAPMMQPQQQQMGGMPGMGGLGSLLKGAMPGQEASRTAGDADLGGYSGAKPGGMFQLPDGTWAMNPNAISEAGAVAPGGGGGSFMNWLQRLF